MDIDLARTFLEIIRSGSFIATAEALPLSQSGGKLLTLGSEVSLCNPLMLAWAQRLRQGLASHAIRLEVASGEELQKKLDLGVLDAALVHQPEYWPSLQVEQLLEEKLIQVVQTQNPAPYLYVDWGPAFRKQHNQALPECSRAALSFSLGPLALQYLVQCGGRGYFRTRVVQRYLDEGILKRVEQAPEFSYPIYLVHARASESPALTKAIELLREIALDDYDWSRWYYAEL